MAERATTRATTKRYGASVGGDLPRLSEVPQGDRPQEHAGPARDDPGGLLGGCARPTVDEAGRVRDDSRQPPGQSGRPSNARGDDDNVKRLLDGMERLLNNNQRSEFQETVKTASSVALPVLPGI